MQPFNGPRFAMICLGVLCLAGGTVAIMDDTREWVAPLAGLGLAWIVAARLIFRD